MPRLLQFFPKETLCHWSSALWGFLWGIKDYVLYYRTHMHTKICAKIHNN